MWKGGQILPGFPGKRGEWWWLSALVSPEIQALLGFPAPLCSVLFLVLLLNLQTSSMLCVSMYFAFSGLVG